MNGTIMVADGGDMSRKTLQTVSEAATFGVTASQVWAAPEDQSGAADDRGGAADQEPHCVIGEAACESFDHLLTHGLGSVVTENHERYADRQKNQTDDTGSTHAKLLKSLCWIVPNRMEPKKRQAVCVACLWVFPGGQALINFVWQCGQTQRTPPRGLETR